MYARRLVPSQILEFGEKGGSGHFNGPMGKGNHSGRVCDGGLRGGPSGAWRSWERVLSPVCPHRDSRFFPPRPRMTEQAWQEVVVSRRRRLPQPPRQDRATLGLCALWPAQAVIRPLEVANPLCVRSIPLPPRAPPLSLIITCIPPRPPARTVDLRCNLQARSDERSPGVPDWGSQGTGLAGAVGL